MGTSLSSSWNVGRGGARGEGSGQRRQRAVPIGPSKPQRSRSSPQIARPRTSGPIPRSGPGERGRASGLFGPERRGADPWGPSREAGGAPNPPPAARSLPSRPLPGPARAPPPAWQPPPTSTSAFARSRHPPRARVPRRPAPARARGCSEPPQGLPGAPEACSRSGEPGGGSRGSGRLGDAAARRELERLQRLPRARVTCAREGQAGRPPGAVRRTARGYQRVRGADGADGSSEVDPLGRANLFWLSRSEWGAARRGARLYVATLWLGGTAPSWHSRPGLVA